MRPSAPSALFTATLLSALQLIPPALTAQPAKPAAPTRKNTRPPLAAEKDHSTQLPVTRVALYKNGVGFFEHSGHVTGNQSVTIDFTTAQLNDVLQSLTAIDLNGGRISGAGYNSTTPLEQQLKALPLALGDDPTAADLYAAIRGAHVEVTGSSAPFTGRILNMEIRTLNGPTENAPATEKRFLTVISDSGTVRSLELTPTTQVRLLDTTLHTDLTRYLGLIAGNRSQGLRHLTLQDNAPANGPDGGKATRDLRVSYISQVPIWKSTYRILTTDNPSTAGTPQTATLQGWAVVDNTVGTDWNNVQLSLIAGSPQSFIQPLSQPIYSRRPEIPIAQDAQLTPQTHESGDAFPQKGTAVASMGEGHSSGIGPGSGGNTGGGPRRISSGVMGGIGSVNQTVSVDAASPMIAYETAAADSLIPQTTTASFDDYFEYKLTDPVTIRKNESALVPILQTKINAERVTLWSPQQPRPLRAL